MLSKWSKELKLYLGCPSGLRWFESIHIPLNLTIIMIRYLSIIILFFFTFTNCFSQSFKKDHFGYSYYKYKNSILKIDSISYKHAFIESFYLSLSGATKSIVDSIVYPEGEYGIFTSRDSLIGRIFRVIDINGFDPPILILKDTLSSQLIYFRYDKDNEYSFPFLIYDSTKVKSIGSTNSCDLIDREVDDFTKEIRMNTPMFIKSFGQYDALPFIVFKTIKGTRIIYDLRLEAKGSTLNVNTVGVIILFRDGTRISKPSMKIDTKYNKGYEYTAFFQLTESELDVLSTKEISKFRLYIYDREITDIQSRNFIEYLRCLRVRK